MLTVVKRIDGLMIRMGGEPHSGWLPAGAAAPLPTPVRDVLMNFEILFDGVGYLFCYSSQEGAIMGDTWHETLVKAERQANLDFGIESRQWWPTDSVE